ncbi:MAG: hypothetical protein ABSA31_00580 [Acidimicrobiales bacterium]|jgi:hypothetical protein
MTATFSGPFPGGPGPERPGLGQRARPAAPGLLAQRTRPLVLARDELLPVASGFTRLLGTPGLRRGSTLAVAAEGASGTTAVALALLARASSAGAWCAAVGLEDLGLVAADELGVALDRFVLVPRPARRFSTVVAALLDGCDIVLAATPALAPADRRRLNVRARERRAVLVVLSGSRAAPAMVGRPWPDGVDVRFSVTGGAFAGLGSGSGRMRSHRVDLVATRRAVSPREMQASLWLPPLPGDEPTALPVTTEAAESAGAR